MYTRHDLTGRTTVSMRLGLPCDGGSTAGSILLSVLVSATCVLSNRTTPTWWYMICVDALDDDLMEAGGWAPPAYFNIVAARSYMAYELQLPYIPFRHNRM